MSNKLTRKQEIFVQEYLVDLNATQAAARAGYSERNADKIGSELLGKTRIQEAVQEAMSLRAKRTGITQDRVLGEYGRIAFSDLSDYITWGPDGVVLKSWKDLTPDQRAAVAEVSETAGGTLRLKLYDKRGALDSLVKHLGMFDRHDAVKVAGVHFSLSMVLPPKQTPALDVDGESVAVEDLSPGGVPVEGDEGSDG